MTKYVLLIIGTLAVLGGFAALLLDPDLRALSAPPWTSFIVLVCIVYSVYQFRSFARSQKYKEAHKGSQAAAISRKSVFANAAILAACNGRNCLAQSLGVSGP